MFFKTRSRYNKTAVILYKITDNEGTVIEYVNVVNGDFENLWLIFKSRIGSPRKIVKMKNGALCCTVRKLKYFVLPV